MKLLKLIPAAAIVLSAFTTFEAKADYPSGWTEKNSCNNNNYDVYKLQKTDTPASYGTYRGDKWIVENVSYKCATKWYKYYCSYQKSPTCP